MFLALRNLVAYKTRYAMTGLTIALGVSFIVGSFMLSDGFRTEFENVLDRELSSVDLHVTPKGANTAADSTVDTSTVETIEATDGVARARTTTSMSVPRIGGIPKSNDNYSEIFADVSEWATDPAFSNLVIVDGEAPNSGEFVVDAGVAELADMTIGETYDLDVGSIVTVTLAGTYAIEQTDGTNLKAEPFGAELFAQLFVADMGVFVDAEGRTEPAFGTVEIIVGDGQAISAIQQQIQDSLGESFEVSNVQDALAEAQAEVDSVLSIFEQVLLGFGFIAVAVAAFIIYNTFSILVTQRTRELGLLRAIGAHGGQIRNQVVIEAALVGLIASAVGIIVGVGLKFALTWALSALAGDLDLPTVLSTRTLVAATGVGVVVTVVSAVIPAIRAGSLSPVVAMGGATTQTSSISTIRTALGFTLFGGGVSVGAFGLYRAEGLSLTVWAMGGGAACLVLGAVVLGPALANGLSTLASWPSSLFGVSGQLATDNARRNPKRTASTAMTLVIGVALVTTALVVGESVKSQVSATIDKRITADFAIFDENDTLDSSLVANVQALPEVGSVMLAYPSTDHDVAIANGPTETIAIEPVQADTLPDLFDPDFSTGTYPEPGSRDIALSAAQADLLQVNVGDEIDLSFGQTETFFISGIYEDILIFSGALVGSDVYLDLSEIDTAVDWIALNTANGFAPEETKAALTNTINNPNIGVDDRASFNQQVRGQIDGLLGIVSGMLLLSIIIAFIGIGLTMALSIFERTQEIGLLRALGMSRSQVQTMVRIESVVIAVFGATLGIAIGLIFGSASVVAFPEEVASTITVPLWRLAILTTAAGVVGLIAAMLPALRASGLNVLEAIAVN